MEDWAHGVELWSLDLSQVLLRGDASFDGVRDLSDAIEILSCFFLGSTCPTTACGLDANGDSRPDISDAISLLGFLFLGDDPPPPCF